MQVNTAGFELIRHYEGFRPKAYKCPAGVWTIGYGSTFYANGKKVREGDTITEQDARLLLSLVVSEFSAQVKKLLKVELKDNPFSAVVSLAYNIGMGNFKSSTLLKKLNTNDSSAAEEFLKWTRAGGKVLPGLVARRHAERLLFIS